MSGNASIRMINTSLAKIHEKKYMTFLCKIAEIEQKKRAVSIHAINYTLLFLLFCTITASATTGYLLIASHFVRSHFHPMCGYYPLSWDFFFSSILVSSIFFCFFSTFFASFLRFFASSLLFFRLVSILLKLFTIATVRKRSAYTHSKTPNEEQEYTRIQNEKTPVNIIFILFDFACLSWMQQKRWKQQKKWKKKLKSKEIQFISSGTKYLEADLQNMEKYR